MRRYLSFARPYRGSFVLAPLLVIIDAGCEIVQPQLMSAIVDRGIGRRDLHFIFQTGGWMLALALLAVAANIGNIRYSSRASVGFAANLRKGLFDRIRQFAFTDIDRFRSASLTTRLTNDVNVLQQVVMMSLRMLIKSPLMMGFAVVLAIRINAGLAVVIAVAIPLLTAGIFFLLRLGLPYFVRMQAMLDGINSSVQENLMNIRVVKAFVREDFEKKRFELSNDRLRDISVKASGTVVLVTPLMQLIMSISIVAIVAFGGGKIMAGGLQVGQMVSFISYMTQILMSLLMFSITVMTFSRAAASSSRVQEILRTEPALTDSPAAISAGLRVKAGKIEFAHVYFKYDPRSPEFVLKDIHFAIQAGEHIALIGATGSAKSTLVQLIPRLYDVTQGTVLIDGHDVRDYSLQHLRSRIAMVLQQNELFSGTIRDNLKWGDPHADDETIAGAARHARAHGFILSLPNGYDTVLGQGGVTLSGGQKQRLCIARALLTKPAVLILDDSTSAVDTATEAAIRANLTGHYAGMTTITIAQRISSILDADKIIVMDDGVIRAMGTHAELLAGSPEYREIYQSQMQPTTVPT